MLELQPSGLLSTNEIAAAKLVHLEYFNTQDQPKITWSPSFAVARAYLDQLARSNGLSPDRITAVRQALDRSERANGQARRDALTQLAVSLAQDAAASSDRAKLQKLGSVVSDLANGEAVGAGRD